MLITEVRKVLRNIKNKDYKFTGVIGKKSQMTDSNNKIIKTLLLRDIKIYGKNKILTDHIWQIYDDKLFGEFNNGDKILIIGEPVLYFKSNGQTDYNINIRETNKL